MKLVNHAYRNTKEEFYEMHSFIKELGAITEKPETWEFVRLEFWSVIEALKSKDPEFLHNNAQLWREESGKLRGLFISESGGDHFNVLVHPDFPQLTREILSFVKDVWGRDCKHLVTDGHIHNHEVNAILEAGFKEHGLIGNTRKYYLPEKELEYELEEGYSIKSIREAPDYSGKWESIYRTYNPYKPVEGDRRYWRAELPSYDEELDLSVVSPEGRHVAFCYGFIDKKNSSAIIETVGTLPEYERRGFAKAVIRECFRRLRERGVETAYITGFSEEANWLYQKLGPVEVYPLYEYIFDRP